MKQNERIVSPFISSFSPSPLFSRLLSPFFFPLLVLAKVNNLWKCYIKAKFRSGILSWNRRLLTLHACKLLTKGFRCNRSTELKFVFRVHTKSQIVVGQWGHESDVDDRSRKWWQYNRHEPRHKTSDELKLEFMRI